MAAALLAHHAAGHSAGLAPHRHYQRHRPRGHAELALDWYLDDPAGKTAEQIRPIRDEIDLRVRALLT